MIEIPFDTILLALTLLLIIVLFRIIQVLGNFNRLIKTNQKEISKATKKLTETLDNVNDVAKNLKENEENINRTMEASVNIIEDISETTEIVATATKNVGQIAEEVQETVKQSLDTATMVGDLFRRADDNGKEK